MFSLECLNWLYYKKIVGFLSNHINRDTVKCTLLTFGFLISRLISIWSSKLLCLPHIIRLYCGSKHKNFEDLIIMLLNIFTVSGFTIIVSCNLFQPSFSFPVRPDSKCLKCIFIILWNITLNDSLAINSSNKGIHILQGL